MRHLVDLTMPFACHTMLGAEDVGRKRHAKTEKTCRTSQMYTSQTLHG